MLRINICLLILGIVLYYLLLANAIEKQFTEYMSDIEEPIISEETVVTSDEIFINKAIDKVIGVDITKMRELYLTLDLFKEKETELVANNKLIINGRVKINSLTDNEKLIVSNDSTKLFYNNKGSIGVVNDNVEVWNIDELGNLKLTKNFNILPKGLIASYNKPNLPNNCGWALCDGTTVKDMDGNDYVTPDLRGMFILGADESHKVGDKGGEIVHKLTLPEIPSHTHTNRLSWRGFRHFRIRTIWNNGSVNPNQIDYNTTTEGNDASHNNMPPFYMLTYIVKL